MSSFTPAQLAERLQTEGETTIAFFKEIPDGQWDTPTYTDGEHWNIHQILTHITQAEDSVLRLISKIVEGGNGSPDDFDLNRYNQRKVKDLQESPQDHLITLFAERRARTVEFVANLRESDLQMTGRHPFLGIAPVEEMLKLMYRHTKLHQRDIRKILDNQ